MKIGETANTETFEPLDRRRIDVWAVRLPESQDLAMRFRPILTRDETDRADRFLFDHLQYRFIVSRGALRVLLARYLGGAPAGIRLRYGSKGKPFLENPELQFNASHSSGLALFGFTRGCELGIDVERIRPLTEIREIAGQFFCPEEASELMSLSPDERTQSFFLCWTRKEAYIKAVGDGLWLPLDSFRVALKSSDPPRFHHLGESQTEAQAWTLHNLEPAPQYAAALAYRDRPRSVRLFPVIEPEALLRLLEVH